MASTDNGSTGPGHVSAATDWDRARSWAEHALGSTIRRSEQLTGGKTSTMVALTDDTGRQSVLRLMTNQPWRDHGPALTHREHEALHELATTGVPAPAGLALDADGTSAGDPAHLMTRLPGEARFPGDRDAVLALAELLAAIHDVQPSTPFRTYQSWAPPAKWTVPAWSRHPHSWQRAFDLLAERPPSYTPTFLHRDFSHRNVLWRTGRPCGVVDWVETSTGPAWLDAGHAATNLALAAGPESARAFLGAYGAIIGSRPVTYWLVMDAVGFLASPGKQPLFDAADELARLDGWLHELMVGPAAV